MNKFKLRVNVYIEQTDDHGYQNGNRLNVNEDIEFKAVDFSGMCGVLSKFHDLAEGIKELHRREAEEVIYSDLPSCRVGRLASRREAAAMILCGAEWDCGGFEPDREWHGMPCVLPYGHDGWHETGRRSEIVTGCITWLRDR